ncbi:MAG: hypothetical protein KA163_03505 [Bacteroidia bacterium]|nr:hypothetical protein [Bacteroidia bacterium]
MKKLFLFSIMCLFTQLSFGQAAVEKNVKPEPLNDPKYLEFKKRHDDMTKNNQAQLSQTSSYFGYDETLKSYFIGNVIPAETPKSTGFTSKSEYVKTLNEWISKNKNVLKPENKNSLITE